MVPLEKMLKEISAGTIQNYWAVSLWVHQQAGDEGSDGQSEESQFQVGTVHVWYSYEILG
jgi:hypothetical protein